MEFLGVKYNLKKQEINICQHRLQGILTTRSPRSRAELWSSLAVLAYSSRFIIYFRAVALPLMVLLHSKDDFRWSKYYEKCWRNLIYLFHLNVALNIYNPQDYLCIFSDASHASYGHMALSYNPHNNETKLINMQSRIFGAGLRKAHIMRKECHSIHQALIWNHNLIMRSQRVVTILTDPTVLMYLGSQKDKNTTLTALSLRLK